jgi:hypothetical protein
MNGREFWDKLLRRRCLDSVERFVDSCIHSGPDTSAEPLRPDRGYPRRIQIHDALLDRAVSEITGEHEM